MTAQVLSRRWRHAQIIRRTTLKGRRGIRAVVPIDNGVAVVADPNMPYRAANLEVDCILKNTHIPVMFWRPVGSSQNAFAVESFIDEMAYNLGKIPSAIGARCFRDAVILSAFSTRSRNRAGQETRNCQRTRDRHPRILWHHRRRNRRGGSIAQGRNPR
jgi:hypothetical protein